VPADTEVLPTVDDPGPGPSTSDQLPLAANYVLRPDRCVIELSAKTAGRTWLWARLAASDGYFDLAAGGDDHELAVTLAASSLRTGIPLLRRVLVGSNALSAAEFPAIEFASTEAYVGEDRAVEIAGHLQIAGTPRELTLVGDLRYVDSARVVLWAKGTLPPPRRRPSNCGRLVGWLARRRVHVEIAIEFVR
jgi:polyisoprenoid-binding protein YceI